MFLKNQYITNLRNDALPTLPIDRYGTHIPQEPALDTPHVLMYDERIDVSTCVLIINELEGMDRWGLAS